jgi:hypothetical protein
LDDAVERARRRENRPVMRFGFCSPRGMRCAERSQLEISWVECGKRQIAVSIKLAEGPSGLATALAMTMGWQFGRREVPGAQSSGPTAVGFPHALELRLVNKKRIA